MIPFFQISHVRTLLPLRQREWSDLMTENESKPRRTSLWHLLLLVPFVALLWVPFYNSIEPAVWGIPFFYWYQFAWVFLTSAVIIWVHYKTD
jgi:hypothetical protein